MKKFPKQLINRFESFYFGYYTANNGYCLLIKIKKINKFKSVLKIGIDEYAVIRDNRLYINNYYSPHSKIYELKGNWYEQIS